MTTLTTEPDRIDLDHATGACIVRLREERDAAVAALRDRDATIARLTAAVEARDAAVREYLAAEAACDAAHVGSLYVQGERDSDEVDAAADRIVAAIKAQDAARDALRKIVEGE